MLCCNQPKPKCINGLPDWLSSPKCSSFLVLALLSCLIFNQAPLNYQDSIAHFGGYVKPFLQSFSSAFRHPLPNMLLSVI